MTRRPNGCQTSATAGVPAPDHHVRNARGQVGEGPSTPPALRSADPGSSRARAAHVARGAAGLVLALVRLAGVPVLAAAALTSYLGALWAHGLADVYPPEVQIADCLLRFDALLSTIVYSGAAPEAAGGHVGVPGVIGASSACVFAALAVRRVAADGGPHADFAALVAAVVHRTARFAARLSLFLLTYTLLAQPEFLPPGVESAVPAALVATTVTTVLAYMLTGPAGASRAAAIVRRPPAVARPPRSAPPDKDSALQRPRMPSGDSFRSGTRSRSPDQPRQEYP
jgi:hypothetical protein